jgi:transcription initiation factor TFIID subunit TAF12
MWTYRPLSAPNDHDPGQVLDWRTARANSGIKREEVRAIHAGESTIAAKQRENYPIYQQQMPQLMQAASQNIRIITVF